MEFVQPDAFAGKGIAIEERHQLHQAAHVAAAVQNEQQIRRRIDFHHGVRVGEFLEHFAQLLDADVLQKNQVEHELIVGGDIFPVDLERNRLADGIGHRNDAVDLALLHHSEAVDAQDHVEQIARIQIAASRRRC